MQRKPFLTRVTPGATFFLTPSRVASGATLAINGLPK